MRLILESALVWCEGEDVELMVRMIFFSVLSLVWIRSSVSIWAFCVGFPGWVLSSVVCMVCILAGGVILVCELLVLGIVWIIIV